MEHDELVEANQRVSFSQRYISRLLEITLTRNFNITSYGDKFAYHELTGLTLRELVIIRQSVSR